jgi:putative FmdB family regulatory protein
MPIFEYKCLKCGNQFEHLVIPTTKDEEPTCPKCQSTGDALETVLSRFSTGNDEGVMRRHMDWVKKESKSLRHDRIETEKRLANED